MEHFNRLTPPELERLALLQEEMAEASQIIGKILRHGYDSFNPLSAHHVTNRELLETELGHVRHAMIRLCESGDLSKDMVHASADMKNKTVVQWLHHQD